MELKYQTEKPLSNEGRPQVEIKSDTQLGVTERDALTKPLEVSDQMQRAIMIGIEIECIQAGYVLWKHSIGQSQSRAMATGILRQTHAAQRRLEELLSKPWSAPING